MKIREAHISYTETEHEFNSTDVSNPQRVAKYMRGAIDFRPEQEQLWVILLDTQFQPLGRILCTLGTANSSLVHPREVFRPAILAAADSIVMVHNHPSGNIQPSAADDKATEQISLAGQIIGIQLADHVILGDGVFSYALSRSQFLEKA